MHFFNFIFFFFHQIIHRNFVCNFHSEKSIDCRIMTGRAHARTKIRKYHSASFTRSSNLPKSNSVRVNKVSSCRLPKPRVS